MLNHIEHWALTVGLRINRKKTEYTTFGDWSKKPQHSLNLSTGEVLSTLDFKYLGCWIKSTQQNLSVRIATFYGMGSSQTYAQSMEL